MKKTLKIILFLSLLIISILLIKHFIAGQNNITVHQLLQEEYINSDTFTISPNNNWIVYSNGKSGEENLMAFDVVNSKKYNLTEKTNSGSILVNQLGLSQECWSADSKYCSIQDNYIDFSKTEPKAFSFSPKTSETELIQKMPRTCSDCNKKMEEYSEGKNCGGFRLLSPNEKFTARSYSCDPGTHNYLYVVNNETNSKTTITNQGNKFHWTSDSKRLYFTLPKNIISYIDID
jgi:uncharacterized protein YxeA